MSSELELKLSATSNKLEKIKGLSFPGAETQSDWETDELINTYYDTSNFKLFDANIGMRIRQSSKGFIQTVKASGKSIGGLHERNEDECLLEENKLNPELITEPYLQILVEEAEEEDGGFIPCFTTNFERSTCLLTFSDDTQIEVALDIGTIEAGEQSLPICEVELELKQGSPEYIFAIGRYLIKELDLTLCNASKARRGYSLCENIAHSYRRMHVVELSQGIESEKAFEQIAFTGLRHWQYHELFLNQEQAHSAILEMYRALIYLHHMYIVFGGLIPRQATDDLRNNWGWLAEAMRPIVDAAKHKRYLVHYLKQKADWDLVDTQREKIQSETEEAIEAFKELLATQRYNLMMLNMSQWLYFKEWRNYIPEKQQEQLKTPIIEFAKKQLEHILKDLKREFSDTSTLQPQDYFQLIAKIRRALDTGLYFGGLFETQKRQSYRKQWLHLLDEIRDLQVNQYIYGLQLENHEEDESLQWLENRNNPILEAIGETTKGIFKSTPYWS
ncbi:MAG: CYTH domain-containing protein [Gammaproteobacteria bacterium]|nr:CYTH domain-containing protein [Gammaproteobacteria bacterium]MDH5628598.1 CYTH domain-containing protein [Gammaproteobacteria bacterium]